MDENTQMRGAGPSRRAVEIGTAVAMLLFGLIVMAGSLQAGIGWGAEGPKSGFFPFYVAVAIVGTSAVNLFEVRAERTDDLFADWGQLRQVMAVVIPAAVYVAVVPWIGIYLPSIVLIALFMVRLGHYRPLQAASLAVGVMVAVYLAFEKWFLVPLPKGPFEEWLGL
jgi:putative tricarboxylic transport membrane protein